MTQKRDAFTDVYVAAIPASPEYCPVLPEERQALIEATKHEQVKAQRYCAWIALLTGLKHSLAIDAEMRYARLFRPFQRLCVRFVRQHHADGRRNLPAVYRRQDGLEIRSPSRAKHA